MMVDPEIRDLQIATARAYAVAERLAYELEGTVEALLDHVQRPALTNLNGHGGDSDDDESGPPTSWRRE